MSRGRAGSSCSARPRELADRQGGEFLRPLGNLGHGHPEGCVRGALLEWKATCGAEQEALTLTGVTSRLCSGRGGPAARRGGGGDGKGVCLFVCSSHLLPGKHPLPQASPLRGDPEEPVPSRPAQRPPSTGEA